MALVSALALAACGTRLEDEAFVSAGSATGSEEVASGPGGRSTPEASDAGGTGDGSAPSRGGGSRAASGGSGGQGSSGSDAGPGGGGATGEGGGDSGSPAAPATCGGQNTASDTGITETTITVGNISAHSGPLGPNVFTPPLHGARAFFQQLNEQGGVCGRKVRFITCDDNESPDRNKECARKLIEQDQVFALVAGSTDTYSSASYVSEQGVPDIGFPIGNAYYKYPGLFSVYGSPGYPRDGKAVGVDGKLYIQSALFRWFKENLGVETAAVMYYNIPISRTAGQFIKRGLEREGIDVVYEPNGGAGRDPVNPSWDSEVIAMRRAGAQSVWHAIDMAGFQKLCQSMDKFDYQVKAAVATVQGFGQVVGNFSSPCRNSVYATGFSLGYYETGDPNIAEVHRAMERFDPGYPMHQWVVDGWMAAKAFTEAVEQMGAAPTRQGVMDFFNGKTDGQYRAGGVAVPYTLYWPRGGIDYGGTAEDCYVVAKWDEARGSFARQTAEPFQCFTGDWYSYEPVPDGS